MTITAVTYIQTLLDHMVEAKLAGMIKRRMVKPRTISYGMNLWDGYWTGSKKYPASRYVDDAVSEESWKE